MRAVVPRRRSVSCGLQIANALNHLETAFHDATFVIAGKRYRILVQIPVVTDLVARGHDLLDRIGIRLDRVSGNEKSRSNTATAERLQQPLNAHYRVLASRNCAGRSG